MSSYSKLIIFIFILVVFSTVVVLIDSSVDTINKSMPEVSDGIVKGDQDYNEAVDLVNNKSFKEAMDKADSAENNFNNSLNKLKEIRGKFSKDISDIHKDYINAAYDELELKRDAVSKLKDAIECFEVNKNATGTEYALEANDYMNRSLEYENSRNSLVENNPNLFKDNSLF